MHLHIYAARSHLLVSSFFLFSLFEFREDLMMLTDVLVTVTSHRITLPNTDQRRTFRENNHIMIAD